ARREFIFNVLGLGALLIVLVAIIDDTIHRIVSDVSMHRADSLSSFSLYAVFAFVAMLYVLSLRGHALLSSFLLLATIFDIAAYMGYRWGVDLSASLLFYALAITMSGILISAEFAFITAALAGIAIGITVHLHQSGFILPDRSWITELWKADDVFVATLIFVVIALVMWLSNREIEKSLARARRSEADLKAERDLLEVRVEERTRELRHAELERMTQAYRFVEFGRLASGIFHDLMNPLAGLSLNIDRIAEASSSRAAIENDIERARRAARHMQDLLGSMRNHLKREAHEELFSLSETIAGAVQMMATYARERGVECVVNVNEEIELYGNAVALTQALMNILGNAIQAYPAVADRRADAARFVTIAAQKEDEAAVLRISDQGTGMSAEVQSRIFEPYFTTKGSEGIGLGLPLTKRIIEQDFNGRISVESVVGVGTTFTLYLPARNP
ncbi:MAG TPA: HAMP domain-containing sensor histidine kinase, partial [Candidatus Paceibacterota bacterium]|nr:HAMP domain-containing sensor histidine kinase [Candidatus Paceibacterota bacterium]